jgi:hypothetical protein
MAQNSQLRIESTSIADIEKIESRLNEYWADFIEGGGFVRMKASEIQSKKYGVLINGDPNGLKIIADNVTKAFKQGSYKGEVIVISGSSKDVKDAKIEEKTKKKK